jgi:hypothetical protein
MRWLTVLPLSVAIAAGQQQNIAVFNGASFISSSKVAPGSLVAIQPLP